MALLEVRQDAAADPDSRKLSAFLNAHLAYDRAYARRTALVNVSAALGVPLWFCTALTLPPSFVRTVLTVFAVGALGALLAVLDEVKCWRRMTQCQAGVRVLHVGDESESAR